MLVFAFDRDWTVDVNPHPNKAAVPLGWVRELAHETEHAVYAIGNQDLASEAAIPGVVDIVGMHPDDWDRWLGDKQADGYYERFPDRRERLELIADLHPEADDYVVVDDLDLSDVDGWDHYHAWDFVPAIERGEVDPSLPWVREPLADGGYPSSAGIVPVDASDLDDWLEDRRDAPGFEVRYADDGTERTELFRDVSIIRGTMRPAAASAVRCQPASADRDAVSIAVDDIEQVNAVKPPMDAFLPETDDPVERAAAIADLAADNPFAVDVSRVLALLDREDDAPQAEALRALEEVASARPGDCTPAVPILRSLLEGDCADPERALSVLDAIGGWDGRDIVPLAGVIETYLTAADPSVRAQATACIGKIVEEDPDEGVGMVPALAMLLKDRDATAHAAYGLSLLAKEFPEAVKPAAPVLGEVITDDTLGANPRLSATAALGRVVGEYPSTALDIVDDVVTLLNAENPKLRNNAVGFLSDVATVHSDVIEPHVDAIAGLLSSDDEYARINASAALARVAEDYPDSVAGYTDDLLSLLDDDHHLVRTNACWALGYLGDSEAVEFLREVAVDDEHDEVRNRASWAITRIEDGP
ncbi:HEAT repeat domain-containing protein [Natronomonas halophila]|uniref:HEAT repeat domain-containing protein n=1 Tax=Natronomonas halophila TaxID=2747817 RepID=UPI0015B4416D|nr:HEAT repeat domain-containing protein [Natronomonas halophila]QLD84523.1 HEAT repeat domain-containing protein [Natronomonas halophila]